jgi:phosphatidylglycerol:prolipoprotein diacylglycerol transferase
MALFFAAIPLPDFDPVAFHIGPIAVRWYGMAYLAAFVAAFYGLREQARRGWIDLPAAAVSDLLTWGVAGVLLGGRLGWWLIYSRPTEATPWYEPFALWNGGMSFHGGLAGVAIGLAAWCYWRGVELVPVADAVALVTPVGLFLGRLANFINGELVGRASGLPWAVQFPGDPVTRHPSQLYEAALEGVVLGAISLTVARRSPRHPGRIAATFLIGYGIARVLVEFTREPDPQIGFLAFGWLTMGQLLSFATLGAGVAWLAYIAHRSSSSLDHDFQPLTSRSPE